MFSGKIIMKNGRDTIVASIKDLWIYIRNKPKWQLFLELVLSVIISWTWMWALLIFLAEYDPWSGAGASIDEQIIAYTWSVIFYGIMLLLSFFIYGRRKLLASFITTSTYLMVPLIIGIVWVCISILFLFQEFSYVLLFMLLGTWVLLCVTLWLLYVLVKQKSQYSLSLGDREWSYSDLIIFWNKNYMILLLDIGLVTAFIFFLYASGFMRDS